jgi:alpha-beta hydrolase superfamily lysophospholipase
LVVLGGSAGALTAAAVAGMAPEARRLVIFGFGSRYFRTDLLHSVREALEAASALDDESIAEELAKVEAHFQEMLSNPTTSQFSSGHSFAYWDSMWRFDQLSALGEVQIPVLAVQGTEDQLVSSEGARQLIDRLRRRGKTNITYKEYEGLDHDFKDVNGRRYRDQVVRDIAEWLTLEMI